MATAADSNILLDAFVTDSVHTLGSGEALRIARHRGPLLIVCDIVYAELVPNFSQPRRPRHRICTRGRSHRSHR